MNEKKISAEIQRKTQLNLYKERNCEIELVKREVFG